MNIIAKFKETTVSVLPVVCIVLFLGLFVVPLDKILLARFVAGGILLIFGLTIFLLGVDMSIQPMGESCGAALTNKRNLLMLLSAAFVIGFIVTAAEPDIQVFGDQVRSVFSFVKKLPFTFAIAGGVGFFIMIGLLRSVLNLSLKITIFISYLVVFTVTIFVPNAFIGIAFDSGGATTGPMTVPFIMALGLGVARVISAKDNNSSFGLTGIASAGPVLAVLVYGIICFYKQKNGSQLLSETDLVTLNIEELVIEKGFITRLFSPFKDVFSEVIHEALMSILPLVGLFIIFQIWLLKMTTLQVVKITIGFIYSFAGLVIFLTGVNGGFSQAGAALGKVLGQNALTGGAGWYVILIITGLIFGAIIVCAEPAVWVLSEQVEQVSGGTIKRKMLLVFLSVGTATAIGLAMWRAVAGFNLKFILLPGYIIAMLLMIFCPPLFSGIAFDSGGVASGPLTSTFVLSFTIGASSGGSSATDSFGVIALVAMMPLIAIQIMGIIYKLKQRRQLECTN